MNPIERDFAKFYAIVGTVDAFPRIVDDEDRADRVKLADLMFADFLKLLARNPEPEGLRRSAGGLQFPGEYEGTYCADGDQYFPYKTADEMARQVFNTVKSQVGVLLRWLLDGKKASPRWEYLDHAPHLCWRVENGRLIETWESEWSDYTIERMHRRAIEPLVSFIRNSKPTFPFARCPQCIRVFVRVRRQKYCTQKCASAAIETARKGQKREYMRKYMADRRKRARRKKAKEARSR